MSRSFTLLSTILLLSSSACSQSSGTISAIGAEYQYNCGRNLSKSELGIRYDGFQNKGNWNFAISYDFGNTKAKGSKESGLSLSAGYNYGFGYSTHGNLFAGGRLTLEFDCWKDGGKTVAKETLLIPKVQAGYLYLFDNSGHWYGMPEIGYGYGLNVGSANSEKKPDEGNRFLTALGVGYRF